MNLLLALLLWFCTPIAHFDAEGGWEYGENWVQITDAEVVYGGAIESLSWESGKPICRIDAGTYSSTTYFTYGTEPPTEGFLRVRLWGAPVPLEWVTWYAEPVGVVILPMIGK